MNGLYGRYGIVNLRPDSKVKLRFRLTDASGTPLTLPALALTILDLDEDGGGHGVEYLTVGGFDAYLLTEASEVQTAILEDGRTLFRASKKGSGENNPFGSVPPPVERQDRGVGLLFKDVHEVNLTLGVGNLGRQVRVFMFVSRPFPCTMTLHHALPGGGMSTSTVRPMSTVQPTIAGLPLRNAVLTASGRGRVMHEAADRTAPSETGSPLHVQGGLTHARVLGTNHKNSFSGGLWALLVPPLFISALACWLSPRLPRRARSYMTLQQLPALGTGLVASPLGTIHCIKSCKSGDFKWSGLVELDDKLYCIPFHADDLLVLDASSHTTRTLASGTAWNGKWSGAAVWGRELYCAPFNADDVLVVDVDAGSTRTIAATGADSSPMGFKWVGIAAMGERLYCAPHNADDVLVIDPATGRTHTIATGHSGAGKWHGIAALDGKLYCAPFNADSVLVVDPEAETTECIPCGQQGQWKWAGIAALGDRLFCAPHDADDVLVVDPANASTSCILTGRTGVWKWSGIAACGDSLYCAPCCADDVLVVQPATGRTESIATGHHGSHKWAGIAAVERRLYCAPSCADGVLEVSLGASAVAM
mmetsp:Transcript_3238/g.10181  ORF Transcript_3238/g.10181 Transcript_3238/m.10181 type:complete len:591 (-) Transcript_3238:76-1848(-)